PTPATTSAATSANCTWAFPPTRCARHSPLAVSPTTQSKSTPSSPTPAPKAPPSSSPAPSEARPEPACSASKGIAPRVGCNISPDCATKGCRKPTDDELSKQEDLFRELLDRNYPRWMGIARCYAAPDAREDLMQEISMQVWKSLDRFAGLSHIDTWAYRIAINTALAWERSTRNRKKRFNKDQVYASQLGSSMSVADGKAEKRILDEFLASLSDVDRAAMLLYLDNMPPTE